jgi:enamine deaminase RidA (YjgF/YER057c/UK114 family)
MGKVEDRLAELGIRLPDVPAPLGSYKPVSKSGNLIFISGQLPLVGGQLLHQGKVEKDVSIEEAADAARACSINALAALKKELESLDAVRQIVKLTGYVSSSPGFGKQANVVNGASDLFYQVFGDAGRHARAAVGVSELPMDSPVEVEVIAEVV